MTEKEFDRLIREQLESLDPDFDPSSWEVLKERMEAEETSTDTFDESVRAAMSGLAVEESAGNWERMQKALELDEREFDNEVKEKVDDYEPHYDPKTWPVLKKKISEAEQLRKRILTAKILEIAAILIALITLHNFFPVLQETIMPQEKDQAHLSEAHHSIGNSSEQTADFAQSVKTPDGAVDEQKAEPSTPAGHLERESKRSSPEQVHPDASADKVSSDARPNKQLVRLPILGQREFFSQDGGKLSGQSHLSELPLSDLLARAMAPAFSTMSDRKHVSTLASLDTRNPNIAKDLNLPAATIEPLLNIGKSMRISMSAAIELNELYIPADHFYSLGKQVSFSEKEIAAFGYSTGASVLFDNGPWTFETGLHYAQKSFAPNRILQVGGTFDIRTLDFQQITLNVVSIPLQAHWNFDRFGKTRFYAVGGASMNVIATAHYDLIAKNISQSAAPSDPQHRRTTEEVKRIREHILDGAKFSAKSYLTVNAGFGIERRLNSKFSLFMQPTVNYQIPFFHISDQNGKHIQFLSAQFGTRVTLK